MRHFLASALFACLAAPSFAATAFTSSTYVSAADIPGGLYGAAGPQFLEDFEDDSLDGGIVFEIGPEIGTHGIFGPSQFRDSVDGDDGTIDGSGIGGHSFFISQGSTDNGVQGGVLFKFPQLVTAAGIAFTDGSGSAKLVAYDRLGAVIAFNGQGFVTGGNLDPSSFRGETGEDNFIGVSFAGGISAIRATAGISHGLELDHLQYGAFLAPVPVPASLGLLAAGLGGLSLLRRRRRAG